MKRNRRVSKKMNVNTAIATHLGAVIAFSGIAALAIPTGIITAGLTERIGHGKAVEDELARQRGKDDEHDRLLKELSDLIGKLKRGE